MTQTLWGIILGGLISIVTLLVTKFFEFFTINKTHVLALKKELFLKKLNVFEKYVSLSSSLNALLRNNAKISELVLKDEVLFDPNEYSKLHEGLVAGYNQILNSTIEVARSIDLYINLPDNEPIGKTLEDFWDIVGEISTSGELFKVVYKQYENAEPDKEDIMWVPVQNQINNIQNSVKKLKQHSQTIHEQYLQALKVMKDDLQRI